MRVTYFFLSKTPSSSACAHNMNCTSSVSHLKIWCLNKWFKSHKNIVCLSVEWGVDSQVQCTRFVLKMESGHVASTIGHQTISFIISALFAARPQGFSVLRQGCSPNILDSIWFWKMVTLLSLCLKVNLFLMTGVRIRGQKWKGSCHHKTSHKGWWKTWRS